jgi:hypothetical protein
MYGTLAGWIAYASDRGFSQPADAVESDALAAMVRASDYIKYKYVANLLPGYDETFQVVIDATYEASLLELLSPGVFNRTVDFDKRKVLVQVDTIRWQLFGGEDMSGDVYSTISTKIESMFRPYVAWVNGPFYGVRSIGG